MELLHYQKGTAVRDEQHGLRKYSHLRALITVNSEIAKAMGATDIVTWKPSDKGIRAGSDLDIINKMYGHTYSNADQNARYPFMVTAMIRFPFEGSEVFNAELEEFHKALAQVGSYAYYDVDRELRAYDYVVNKDSQFLPWLRNQDKSSDVYKKLSIIMTSSPQYIEVLKAEFPDKKCVFIPHLDYQDDTHIPKFSTPFEEKTKDFLVMRSFKDWSDVFINTTYDPNVKFRALTLENTALLGKRIDKTIEACPQLELSEVNFPLGAHLERIHSLVTKSLVHAPAGNPKLPGHDGITNKIYEAKYSGSLTLISEYNPYKFALLNGLSVQLTYKDYIKDLNNILEYTRDVTATEYQSDVENFARNITSIYHPSNWKAEFSEIVSSI